VLLSILRISTYPPVRFYTSVDRPRRCVFIQEILNCFISTSCLLQSDFDFVVLLHGLFDLLFDEPPVPVCDASLPLHFSDLSCLFINDLIELDGLVAEPLNLPLQRAHLVILEDCTCLVLCYLLVLSELFLVFFEFLIECENDGLIMLIVFEEIVLIELVDVTLKLLMMRLQHLPHRFLRIR